ncbi:MAG: hypothetical protein AB7W47_02360 [Calditrichaceae bacterium]
MKRFLLIFFLFIQLFLYHCDKKAESSENPKILFELIYISNLNGSLENCGCGDPPLGGVDRIASVINQKRSENPNLLFIDGGDFLNTYPFRLLNSSVVEGYKYLKPDGLILGDQEFVEGPGFLNRLALELRKSIIASNYMIQNTKLRENLVFKSPSGETMRFFAYLDPESFDFIKADSLTRFDPQKFDSLYHAINKEEISVVIYHGTSVGLESFLNKYSDFDLILSSHEQSLKYTVNSSPAVISGGADGKSVINIQVLKSETDIEYRVFNIPIGLEIEPEPAVSDIIYKYINNLH